MLRATVIPRVERLIFQSKQENFLLLQQSCYLSLQALCSYRIKTGQHQILFWNLFEDSELTLNGLELKFPEAYQFEISNLRFQIPRRRKTSSLYLFNALIRKLRAINRKAELISKFDLKSIQLSY